MRKAQRKAPEHIATLIRRGASWHQERRLRISSTKAHLIRTKRDDKGLQKAAQKLLKSSSYKSAAMCYGITTEGTAREDLERRLGARIVQTVLVVLPEQPWLCCSPDGLVQLANETVLIEIKCTYKFKDTPFIRYEERHCELPYLIFIDDKIELRKSHQYYTQLQVQMYVLNLQKALLFVYS